MLPALVLQLISANAISLLAVPFTVAAAWATCVLEVDGVVITSAGGALEAPGGVAGGVAGGAVEPGLVPALRVIEKLAVAYRCVESEARTTTLFAPTASGMLLMFQLADVPLPATAMLPFNPPPAYQFMRHGPAPALSRPPIERVLCVVSAAGELNDTLNGDAGAVGVVVGGFGVGVGVVGGVEGVGVAATASA